MYDTNLKEWLVRGVLKHEEQFYVSWYTKFRDDIPDWVWEASPYNKEEHLDVVGDDGTRFPNYCSTGCPDYWIGDDYCDQACLNEACQ